MLVIKILLLILAWRIGGCFGFSLTKNANNYGPYTLSINKYESCKGPKAVNTSTMLFELNEDKPGLIKYNTTFHVSVRLSEIKIQVWYVEKLQKHSLWNYKIDKPCQHFAISRMLSTYLSMQPNCIVKKGEFHFQINLISIVEQFFGNAFFYGEFSFKVVILSNQGNVMCLAADFGFNKKTKSGENL